jgi:hypothetical protein
MFEAAQYSRIIAQQGIELSQREIAIRANIIAPHKSVAAQSHDL